MAFGGFYTRQEQEDAMAARLNNNPNRVGSGFVDYGAQQRAPTAAAANWQTAGLVGTGRKQLHHVFHPPRGRDACAPHAGTGWFHRSSKWAGGRGCVPRHVGQPRVPIRVSSRSGCWLQRVGAVSLFIAASMRGMAAVSSYA